MQSELLLQRFAPLTGSSVETGSKPAHFCQSWQIVSMFFTLNIKTVYCNPWIFMFEAIEPFPTGKIMYPLCFFLQASRLSAHMIALQLCTDAFRQKEIKSLRCPLVLFPTTEIPRALLDIISGPHVELGSISYFSAGVKGLQKCLGVDEHGSRVMAIPGWTVAPRGTVTIQRNAEQPVITRACFGYGGRRKGTYDFLL